MSINTILIHGDGKFNEKTAPTLTPIYQTTSFRFKTAEDLEEVFLGQKLGYTYTRINNPTVDAFEKRLALIEKGIGAIATASGMAAVSLAILNIVKHGDEIISGSGIFGGTYSLFNDLKQYGIKTRYAKDNDISSFEEVLTQKTKLIFVETIGNPKLDVPDIKKLSEFAHKNNIPLIVDSTVTTPYLIRPLEHGADIVVHSTSKYINGNGNSIGGIIIDKGRFKWNFDKFPMMKNYEKFGPFTYLAKLRKGIHKDFGVCMAPMNAFMNSLGLETLGLRVERHCSNALKLALSLKNNSKVLEINYLGLEDNPYHQIAKVQFNNNYGALLTIRVGSKEKAFKVINNLKYAANLANIGDTRTLVIHPASTIYADNKESEKVTAGVYEDLIRISVGIEDVEDIINDFEQALDKI